MGDLRRRIQEGSQRMMVITLILYYAGWFFTIALAAAGRPFTAALACLLAGISQLVIHYFYNRSGFYREVFLALYAIMIGFFTESLFLNLSITGFTPPGLFESLPPLWIVFLYPLFSLTINGAMHWMMDSKVLQVMIGALAPICYIAGAKVGACLLPRGYGLAYLVIGIAWPLVILSMTTLLKKIEALVESAIQKSTTSSPLYMLYDGKCPICIREARFLMKKNSSLVYIDITTPEFTSLYSVGYDEAMQEMVALEADGTKHVGIDAFHEIYLRRGLLFLAIAMKLPGLEAVWSFFYKLFARNRLKITGRDCSCR